MFSIHSSDYQLISSSDKNRFPCRLQDFDGHEYRISFFDIPIFGVQTLAQVMQQTSRNEINRRRHNRLVGFQKQKITDNSYISPRGNFHFFRSKNHFITSRFCTGNIPYYNINNLPMHMIIGKNRSCSTRCRKPNSIISFHLSYRAF